MLLVLAVSSRVDVTVKVVEVPWSEMSVELTVTVRPEIEIQLAVGVIVRVSPYEQFASCVQAGIVHE